MAAIQSGRPIYLGGAAFTLNHRFGGNESAKYEGVDPTNIAKHDTFVDVDPITGAAFRGAQVGEEGGGDSSMVSAE